MTQDNLLSVSTVAREMNVGKATIKFLLKRFRKHIPAEQIGGQFMYPPKTIPTLIAIQEKLEMGHLPSEIEKQMATDNIDVTSQVIPSLEKLSQSSDIRLSNDGLTLLKSVFSDIGEQQKRIANAHEKRAQAEERKAVAIEKRASAEEKKAEAMNNIAAALQEMNQIRSNDTTTQQIVHQAAEAIAIDENESIGTEDDDLSDLLDHDTLPQGGLNDAPLPEDAGMEFDEELEESLDDALNELEDDLLIDDLSSLTDDTDPTEDPDADISALDDLSSLIDTAENENTEDESKEQATDGDDADLDDLSLLIDPPDTAEEKEEPPKGEPSPTKTSSQNQSQDQSIDDLSLLIDAKQPSEDATENEIDDLSALIEPSQSSQPDPEPDSAQTNLDDLSKLIDDNDAALDTQDSSPPMDDLSALIDEKDATPKEEASPEMDDLSKLIDEDDQGSDQPEAQPTEQTPPKEDHKVNEPKIKIDILPEDNLEKYKSAVMKVIIELKAKGLSIEETTDRLNKDEVKTLSGKSKWGQKAITQIYKFIDSAK